MIIIEELTSSLKAYQNNTQYTIYCELIFIMVIRTNTTAIRANKALRLNTSAAQDALQKLSSGLRVNKAADDAAGLSISEKMKARINGLNQAQENINNGVSLLQTADGTFDNIQNVLQKLNELGVQAQSGTLSDSDLAALQAQASQLGANLDEMVAAAQFNGSSFLGRDKTNQFFSADGVIIQSGAESGQTSSLNLNNLVPAAWVGVENNSGGNVGTKLSVDSPLAANQPDWHYFSPGSIPGGGNFAGGMNINITSSGVSGTVTIDGINFKIASATTSSGYPVNSSLFSGSVTSVSGVNFELENIATGERIGTLYNPATINIGPPSSLTLSNGANDLSFRSNFNMSQQVTVDGQQYTANIFGESTYHPGGNNPPDAVWAHFSLTDAFGNYVQSPDYDDNGNYITNSGVWAGFPCFVTMNDKTGSVTDGLESQQPIYLTIHKMATLQADDSTHLYLSAADATALNVSFDDGSQVHRLSIGWKDSVQMIQKAIDNVSTFRAHLGAFQNGLSFTLGSLSNESENLTSAVSVLIDADMAKEMICFTKSSILTQSAQAMLAQANQMPQSILSLLKQ